MSNYANYDDYLYVYLNGRDVLIPSATFDYYSQKASSEIRSRIYNDITVIDDDVKCCTCEIAEYIYNVEQNVNSTSANATKGISSESVGGYSVSYGTSVSSEYTIENRKISITGIVSKWLGNKGYMGRGVVGVY